MDLTGSGSCPVAGFCVIHSYKITDQFIVLSYVLARGSRIQSSVRLIFSYKQFRLFTACDQSALIRQLRASSVAVLSTSISFADVMPFPANFGYFRYRHIMRLLGSVTSGVVLLITVTWKTGKCYSEWKNVAFCIAKWLALRSVVLKRDNCRQCGEC